MTEAKPPPGYRYVNCLLPSAPDGTWREFGIWLPPQMTTQEVAKLRAYVELLAEVAYPAPAPLDLRPMPACPLSFTSTEIAIPNAHLAHCAPPFVVMTPQVNCSAPSMPPHVDLPSPRAQPEAGGG